MIYTVIKRVTSNRLLQKNLTNDDLAPGRYPYIEASHYTSGATGRPLSAHVIEQSRKSKKPAKPKSPDFKKIFKKK